MDGSGATSALSSEDQSGMNERPNASASSPIEELSYTEKRSGRWEKEQVEMPGKRGATKDEASVQPPSDEADQEGRGGKGMMSTLRERWSETVTHEEASIPLAWQALLTGLVDALIYGRSSIWTGFQTGERERLRRGGGRALMTSGVS